MRLDLYRLRCLDVGVRLSVRGGGIGGRGHLVVAVAAVAIAACGDDDKDGPTIRAAGFNFAESHILSWIYAIALEEEGFPVDTSAIQPGSTREIIKPALESGDLDYVPEYVGTLLRFLGGEPTSDGAFNHAEAERLYAENCARCHGPNGEGDADAHIPRIHAQHFKYLVRQFEWIRDGKRRNADAEMAEQIQAFEEKEVHAVLDYVSRLVPPEELQAPPDWKNPDFAQ